MAEVVHHYPPAKDTNANYMYKSVKKEPVSLA